MRVWGIRVNSVRVMRSYLTNGAPHGMRGLLAMLVSAAWAQNLTNVSWAESLANVSWASANVSWAESSANVSIMLFPQPGCTASFNEYTVYDGTNQCQCEEFSYHQFFSSVVYPYTYSTCVPNSKLAVLDESNNNQDIILYYCIPCATGYYPKDCTATCDIFTGCVHTSTGTCTRCPEGFACGGPTVTQCLAGSYSPAGEMNCLPCPLNSVSNDGAAACDCNDGLYMQSNQCVACPAGTVRFFYDPNYCQACSPGQYADSGMYCVDCTSCYPGAVVTQSCTLVADAVCDCCPAGKYTSTYNAGSCASCPAGKVSDACASDCQSCGAGKYYSAGTCQPCAAGTYAPANTCLACAIGTFSGPGQTACTQCTVCSAYTASQCTAAADSVCGSFRVCAANTTVLRTMAGSPILDSTGNYQCTQCVQCPPGSIQFQACTPLAQTICARCSVSQSLFQYQNACVSAAPKGYSPAQMLVPGSVLQGFTNNTQAFPVKEQVGTTYNPLAWPAGGLYLNLMVPCSCV